MRLWSSRLAVGGILWISLVSRRKIPKTRAVSSCGFALMLAPDHRPQRLLRLEHAEMPQTHQAFKGFKIHGFGIVGSEGGLAELPCETSLRATLEMRQVGHKQGRRRAGGVLAGSNDPRTLGSGSGLPCAVEGSLPHRPAAHASTQGNPAR
jgi:hypothetical protein